MIRRHPGRRALARNTVPHSGFPWPRSTSPGRGEIAPSSSQSCCTTSWPRARSPAATNLPMHSGARICGPDG